MNNNGFFDERKEEKYLKTKAKVQFEDMDFSNVIKFSKATEIIVKLLCIPAVIIGIITISFVIKTLVEYWNMG